MPVQLTPSHEVPVLETARLRLRGYQLSDYPVWTAMHQDPAYYRYLSGSPLPAEEVWTRLLRLIGHWTLLGYGYWAVEEKASGRFIGAVGFADFQREIEPPLARRRKWAGCWRPTPTARATPARPWPPPSIGATRISGVGASCA